MASRLTANGARTASIQARTVHLAITPRPANIGESREIYRIMARFGEVDYYKNLEYDRIPTRGKAFVVFRTEAAAAECIARAPIRFTMGKAIEREDQEEEPEMERASASPFDNDFGSNFTSRLNRRATNGKGFGMNQTRPMSTKISLEGLPVPASRSLPVPPQFRNGASEPSGALFNIKAHAVIKDIRSITERGYYHGNFVHDLRTVPNEDLRHKVPVVGMANLDFRKDTKAQRFVDAERAESERYIRSLPFGPLRVMAEEHQRKSGSHANLLPAG